MAGDWESAKSVYDFTVKDIKGEDVRLDKYKYEMLYQNSLCKKLTFTCYVFVS